MNWLIWPGALLAVLGVFGLVYCMRAAVLARREKLDEGAMKQRLQGLVALNMAALGVSSIGLGMVVVGILLG